MDDERSNLPALDLQDLWDWSYCPMRVWWRREGGAEAAGGEMSVGEALVRSSVRRAIQSYYRTLKSGGDSTLPQAFGRVWRRWLRERGLDRAVADDLLAFHASRMAILDRFGPEGDLRRPDGSPYQRPTWTRAWQELARAEGLTELEQKIDRAAQAAGVPRHELLESPGLPPAMGLAEAFSTGLQIVEGLTGLPAADEVLAVDAPAFVDLLSARLECRVDLVVDLGERPVRGRPPKGSEGPRMARRLAFELHLFDEDLPSLGSLQHDLRVLTLSQATLSDPNVKADEFKMESLIVRHMRSGRAERIRPLAGADADLLEGLARATLMGLRTGAYTPRLVCGWRACGDCECRPLCFAGDGIMRVQNPPQISQIQANQRLQLELRDLLENSSRRTI